MRKIKRVLAVISAVATLAVSAVPVSAETTDENIKAENIDIAFGSDYFDTTDAEHNSYAEIKYGLAEYINENHIYGQIITGFTNENNEDYILVNYHYTNTDVEDKVKEYLINNGYDTNMVKFNRAGISHDDADEKITDVLEILALLSDHCHKNDLTASAYIIANENKLPNAVSIYIYTEEQSKVSEAMESINSFINDKGIDPKKVCILNAIKDYVTVFYGDVNGDGDKNVRDCAAIAKKLSKGEKLPESADYNRDGIKNIRDASALARDLASK